MPTEREECLLMIGGATRRSATKYDAVKVLYQQAVTLLRRFDSYRILHLYRDMNKLADRLANRGIDEAIRR